MNTHARKQMHLETIKSLQEDRDLTLTWHERSQLQKWKEQLEGDVPLDGAEAQELAQLAELRQ